jgi:hypothetical protein
MSKAAHVHSALYNLVTLLTVVSNNMQGFLQRLPRYVIHKNVLQEYVMTVHISCWVSERSGGPWISSCRSTHKASDLNRWIQYGFFYESSQFFRSHEVKTVNVGHLKA